MSPKTLNLPMSTVIDACSEIPSTVLAPGYVVADHVVPLAYSGRDPSNMQWQTTADAKAKDRVGRVGYSS
jgi:hypothetical protein